MIRVITKTYKEKICAKCRKVIPIKSPAKFTFIWDKSIGCSEKVYYHFNCLNEDADTLMCSPSGEIKRLEK